MLPFTKPKSKPGQAGRQASPSPPSSPKLTPRKVILVIFLSLLGLSLLHRPVTHCYNGFPKYGHGQGLLTPEERARNILATTPLIGKHRCWRISENLIDAYSEERCD